MNVYRVKTGSILPLGKQGENLARKIQFDISCWISTFGPGTVQLLHQRSGDEAPYPVAVEREGNFAVWTVTNADTAAPGTGRAELQYYVGDALAKSETWMTKVFPALGDAGETPPEAQQSWVDQVLAQVARITGMTAHAVELPAGSAPTADYKDGVLTIGIPKGGDVSEAQIAQAVADYLAENPIEETDPTIPAWAKEEKKPSYTATEVGADPSGTAAGQVSAHNAETTAHNDMRLLIQSLTDRLNALVDSDDTTLDQLSEIVAYIKGNRELIAAVTTDKVSVADIVNNLTTNVANKPLSAAQGVALKAMIDAITIPTALPNPSALTFTGAVTGRYDGSEAVSVEIPSGGGGLTVTNTAAVGQTVKIAAVDETGQPTEWEAVDMASGGGHWETVLDTVWEQDVINPTDFDSETGIFTCAEGELGNLELDKKYVFYQQCVVEGIAYNTILPSDKEIVTKLSETTFSIDATPPTTFVPTNVKFSKGAPIAITDIDAKKIRLTLDGQFKPTATLYDCPFYGTNKSYFGRNVGYMQIRNAYLAYQQVTVEVESPFRIVGEILCGFNAPSNNASFHFKNNSFCCPLVPYDAKGVNEEKYFLTSDGTKIAKLYSTSSPWLLDGSHDNTAILNDYLSIISGTRVKMERWVE